VNVRTIIVRADNRGFFGYDEVVLALNGLYSTCLTALWWEPCTAENGGHVLEISSSSSRRGTDSTADGSIHLVYDGTCVVTS
jgi:hypothetical protein